jgi:rhodanese-related sulfurtransferase
MVPNARCRLLRWGILLIVLLLPLLAGCSLFRRSGKRPPFRKLNPAIAYELIRDNPGMLILDLRPPQEYNGETGHIRQAQNVPLARLRSRLKDIVRFRDDTLLVYCGAGDCGPQGMDILLANGFDNAVLMEGGIDAWIREGFKTVLPTTVVGQVPPPADGKGPVMPAKPGEPSKEVPVPPPNTVPPPKPSPPRPSSSDPSLPPSPGEEGEGPARTTTRTSTDGGAILASG